MHKILAVLCKRDLSGVILRLFDLMRYIKYMKINGGDKNDIESCSLPLSTSPWRRREGYSGSIRHSEIRSIC